MAPPPRCWLKVVTIKVPAGIGFETLCPYYRIFQNDQYPAFPPYHPSGLSFVVRKRQVSMASMNCATECHCQPETRYNPLFDEKLNKIEKLKNPILQKFIIATIHSI